MKDNYKNEFGRFDFFFIFCSMPALTGFFFSFFDIMVLIFCFLRLLRRQAFYKNSGCFLLLCLMVVLLSGLINLDSFKLRESLSFAFLFLVLFSVSFLIKDGFFTAKGALHYWALGLIPGFLVIFLQQLYPALEIFNYNELKSNPVPGLGLIRGSGLLYNPNSFAAYAIICFLYFLHKRYRFSAALSVASALLTFSKTFFLIPLAFVFYKLLRFKLREWVFVMLFCSLVFYLSYDALMSLMGNRLENADSFGSRMDIIIYYLSLDYNFLSLILGNGAYSDTDEVGRIHNKFISIFFQFGLAGFFLLSFFYLFPLWVFIKSSVRYVEKLFLIISIFLLLSLSMVSTFTFFSFDYVILILLLAYHNSIYNV